MPWYNKSKERYRSPVPYLESAPFAPIGYMQRLVCTAWPGRMEETWDKSEKLWVPAVVTIANIGPRGGVEYIDVRADAERLIKLGHYFLELGNSLADALAPLEVEQRQRWAAAQLAELPQATSKKEEEE